MTANRSTDSRRSALRSIRLPEELERRLLFATITVTGTGDTIAADGIVTLREAITSANTNADLNADVTASRVGAYGGLPGADAIHFNIPGAGVQTISPTASLPTISDPLTIDGYTQPGAIANTNGPGLGDNAVLSIELDGSSAGANVDGLTLGSILGVVTIRGLVINRFSASGITVNGLVGGSIEGNFIGTDPTGTLDRGNAGNGITSGSGGMTIGGATPSARNILSGNTNSGVLCGSTSRILGNFIGADATGTIRLANSVDGIRVTKTGPTVGGTGIGEGNLISGNSGSGVTITGMDASLISVQGNLIGTDVTGTKNIGNLTNGVFIENASGNLIGGTAPGARNVISGNFSANVLIKSDDTLQDADRNRVQGNYVGTDITGALPLAPIIPGFPSLSGAGVAIYGAMDGSANKNLVGGVVPNAGNVIAFTSTAVSVVADVNGSAVDNLIRGNSIFSNMAGIELGSDGPTANDPKDPDTGPNYLQNFPVLASASSIGGTTTITGTINSTPGTALLIDFYASPTIDPSERGQGKTYIGAVPANTDASGNAIYTGTFPLNIPGGQFITATANTVENAPFGSTSEFSEPLPVTGPAAPPPAPPTFSIGDITQAEGNGPGATAFTFTITRSGDLSATSSVLYSTADGTAIALGDYAAVPSTLVNFAANQATAMITVNVVGDGVVEPDETFFVNLSGATGGTIADAQAIGTITNDDVAPPATVVLGPDPSAPGKTALLVTGTDNPESIEVDPVGTSTSKFIVQVNGVQVGGQFSTSNFGRIVIDAKDGDDHIDITSKYTHDTLILAGKGNDTVKGGYGADIIVGGDGNDVLSGRKGRDLIIGGAGGDGITGDEDDDLLIAAATTYDADLPALYGFMKEWTSSNSYSKRRDNVRNGAGSNVGGRKFNDASIIEDTAFDQLSGNSGTDLFFYHKSNINGNVADKLVDKSSAETAVDSN